MDAEPAQQIRMDLGRDGAEVRIGGGSKLVTEAPQGADDKIDEPDGAGYGGPPRRDLTTRPRWRDWICGAIGRALW